MAVGSFSMSDMLAALEKFEPQPQQTLLIPKRMRAALETEAAVSNPLVTGYTIERKFRGLGVEVFDIPPETVYDWSGCRSPARAQRRHKLGFQQRVKITTKDVAYLIDKDAMRRMTHAWERRCVKMLIG